MSARWLALLVLAALLATGGAFWLSSQRHLERANRAGDPLLPQLRGTINAVAEIRVSRGDGSVATLRRTDDGWTVVERGYRADPGKVRKLLLDLTALAIVEEKTHDPARYPVLGVEDVASPVATGTRVDVRTASGAVQGLIVGKPSGTREGFVRVAAAPASFLARPQVVAEANPARWLDTALLDLDPARVRAVTIESPGKPARAFEGPQLTPALASALQGLALEDVRSRALAAPGARTGQSVQRARFTTWDGLVVDVEGREDGSRRWIALAVATDPGAARPAPAPASAGRPPPPAANAPQADPRAEAKALMQRVDGREFEIPSYRFSTLFDATPPAA